jgi:hypothetical protein
MKVVARRAAPTGRAAGQRALLLFLLISCLACGGTEDPSLLTISGSAVGAEAQVMRLQLERFNALHNGVRT